ncbi:MFS family permease [Bosea sp. OAE752]|jgi:MFS family permease|uniref:MHS family MFS transporter n=1 Tax=Bosea spartocytisi TaxID=2773451 RepID=A0A927HZQ7_9HYPH|nr:MFS transporter [Bosea spartocytisi]MBD3845562.1 MHS family MFS transporter [Bosea spartocytisi]MCT4472855.1 MHS family MFS transporter [Bosea spartocytisi]
MTTTDASTPAATEAGRANLGKAVTAATVGTVIEWYDYALYGAASGVIINKLFFPNLSPTTGVLAAFATFAVGYFARPVGGIVISHIGDTFGRKPALILTITLMGLATVLMGLLPTYESIGLAAPILLVLMRLIQGFGAGAELAGAIVLVAEYAPPSKRAFYTGLPNAATLVGIMLATLSFLLISYLPEDVLLGWAWRVPFLISGALFLVAFYIRKHLDETPEYVAAMARAEAKRHEQRVPLGELFRNSPREVLFGFLSVTGHNANAYILSAFSLSYMINTVGMSRTEGLVAVTIGSLFGIAGVPIMGALADRIGSAKVYAGGALFVLLLAYPLFWMFDTHSVVWSTVGIGLGYGIGFGAMAGAQGAFLANLFPTRYRFSGLAMSRELNGVLVAGPTPLIAASLVAAAGGKPTLVAAYLMACCALTIIAVLVIKHRSIHD